MLDYALGQVLNVVDMKFKYEASAKLKYTLQVLQMLARITRNVTYTQT